MKGNQVHLFRIFTVFLAVILMQAGKTSALEITAANSIVAYEYWFDNDYSGRTIRNIPLPTTKYTTNFSTSGLSLGLHQVNIRFKDSNGKWGGLISEPFFKFPTRSDIAIRISSYEYWFDEDYSTVKKVNLPPSGTLTLQSVDLSGLGPGIHRIHIRYRDDAGQWSQVCSDAFNKFPVRSAATPKIDRYEYWFNDDYGNLRTIPVSPGQIFSMVSLDVAWMNPGFHRLNIRYRDDAGIWSTLQTEMVNIFPARSGDKPEITSYEYWFNDDFEHHKTISVSHQQSFSLDKVDASFLPNGFYRLNIRYRDNAGQYSPVFTDLFSKYGVRQSGAPSVNRYEYWFDDNIAARKSVTVPPQQLFSLNSLDFSGMPDGFHQLNMRFRDDAGQWSPVISEMVTKYPVRAGAKPGIILCEYWFNDDYAGHQTIRVTSQPALSLNTLNLSALQPGFYRLNMRYRDDAGQWSQVTTDHFQKLPVRTPGGNKIITYRYWIDQNFAGRQTITVSANNPYVLLKDISQTGLTTGEHHVHFQFRDVNRQWGPVSSVKFVKNAALPEAPVAIDPTNISLKSFSANWNLMETTTGYIMDVSPSNTFSSFVPGYQNKDIGMATSFPVTDLIAGNTYYYRIRAYNQAGTGPVSNAIQVVLQQGTFNCVFADCNSPGNCGGTTYQAEAFEAVQFLCERNIVRGIGGNILPKETDYITRAQLAKIALYGVYRDSSNVPEILVSDFFPSPYADLQDPRTYYYRAAKALLYLQYTDRTTPFDRDRFWFYPDENISRRFVMKVLMETFNIKPSASTDPVFNDFFPSQEGYGYAKRAFELGITQVNSFRPDAPCTRAEAFIFLYRIMTNAVDLYPVINNTLDLATSSFLIPFNMSLAGLSGNHGIESGNFNHYTKSCFTIPGRNVSLDFGFFYNSYITEFPSEVYPIEPLGRGWGHNWNMYLHFDFGTTAYKTRFIVHMPDGGLLVYKINTDNKLVSVTQGNYNTLTFITGTKYEMKTKNQVVFTLEQLDPEDVAFMLTSVKDRYGNTVTLQYYQGVNYQVPGGTTFKKTRVLASVTDPEGRQLRFNYQPGTNLLATVSDPINRNVLFSFTGGQLTGFTDAKSQQTTYNYGTTTDEKSLNLLRKIRLPKGNEITNEYLQRKLTSTRYNNNSPTLIEHNPNYVAGKNNFYKSSVTVPQQTGQAIVTHYESDTLANMTKVYSKKTLEINSEYGNALHPKLPSKVTNSLTAVTVTPSYDNMGNVLQVTTSGV